MMRVIRGNFKGKKIFFPEDKNTRPLRDLVKESIFNFLEHSNKIFFKFKDANILDLFSGSGAFGIECISRGAKNVFFIENYSEALKTLKRNISSLNILHKCNILEKDCFNILNYKKKFNSKFDLIFIDPPYKENKINLLINEIKNEQMLSKNGIIIIHRHKKDNLILTNKLNIIDSRRYGISKIIVGN